MPQSHPFHTVGRRRVEAEFTGAEVTSNGGALLLAEADRRMGLTRAAAKAMGDDRRRRSRGPLHAGHRAPARPRPGAGPRGPQRPRCAEARPAACGKLRFPQAAAGRDAELAIPSTLCRFERKSGPAAAAALHEVLFEQFVKANRRFVIGKLCFPQAHPKPPKRIVLDFDATDVTLH